MTERELPGAGSFSADELCGISEKSNTVRITEVRVLDPHLYGE